MGLDTVEFVLEVEDVFGVSIPDEDAERLGVLGDLARYIADKRSNQNAEADFDMILRRLIDILVANYGVPVGKANAQSHVVSDLGLD